MLLSDDWIKRIYRAAIDRRFTDQRSVLLAKVNQSFVAGLPHANAPAAQLLLDLRRMNEVDHLLDGSVPLEAWLDEATMLATGNKEELVFQEALDELRRGRRRDHASTPPPARPRAHFLDDAPFKIDRPESQELWSILEENIYRPEDIVEVAGKAGVPRASIRVDQTPHHLWHSVLEAAAARGKARSLVEIVANDPGWAGIRPRLVELLGNTFSREPLSAALDWKAKPPAQGFERGTRPGGVRWVNVHFLTEGTERAKSVVRVDAFFGGQSFMGTGFFIAKGRLLTNHHVLFQDGAKADRVEIWLGYESAADGNIAPPQKIHIDAPVIYGNREFDCATLEVNDAGAADISPLALGSQKAPKIGDYASIIQHPHGLPKKLGIFGSDLRYIDDNVLQYLTDTEVGSSGAPVFNERWEVIALHHAWKEIHLPGGGAEVRNEGIRIERVKDVLRREGKLA
ncbi:MAG: trypsin-like peptidase domain-containing protein [Byssovorax sp.]